MTRRRSTILAGTIGASLLAGAVPAAAATTPASAVPANRQASLAAAQRLLADARHDLQQARADAARVQLQAMQGVIDPAAVARLTSTGSGFTVGASDLEMVAALMNPADPSTVLSEASVQQLSTVTAAAEQTPDPVPVRTPQQAMALAQHQVTEARRQAAAARALLQQLTQPGTADGPGAAKLARLCANAGVVIAQCQPVRWTEGHLQYDTVMIGRTVAVTWPEVKLVGGWRPSDPYPDHPSGRAADIMMPNGGTGSDVALGNQIARYFQKHAGEYGISYMIWRQQQWKAGDPVGAWNAMSDRGSPTANHFDHVHITVTDGDSSTIFRQLVRKARATGISLGSA